jgi:Ca2+:H+ antiporter
MKHLSYVTKTIYKELSIFLGGILLALNKWYGGYVNKVLNVGLLLFVILFIALRVVDHAHVLAERVGEPQGSLILTLAVVTIEVAMIASGLNTGTDPYILRNTTFAVLILALTGVAGVSLFIGGLRYRVQLYNTKGMSAYMSMLAFTSTLCFIMPSYNSVFINGFNSFQTVVICVILFSLYIAFIISQTITHKLNFQNATEDPITTEEKQSLYGFNVYQNTFILTGLLIIIKLSKFLLYDLNYLSVKYAWPGKVAGLVVAALVLSPEALSAIKAASNNDLQKSLNISFGSAIASLSLTLPTILMFNLVKLKRVLYMSIGPQETVILCMTNLVMLSVFNSRGTTYIFGMILISIFIAYIVFT